MNMMEKNKNSNNNIKERDYIKTRGINLKY